MSTCLSPDQLNTFDVLVNDFIVFTKATFEATCESRPAPADRKAARAAAMMATLTDANDDSADTGMTDQSAEQPEAAIANDADEEE